MTFESEGLLIFAIHIWLLPASYVVFLTFSVFFLGSCGVNRSAEKRNSFHIFTMLPTKNLSTKILRETL